MLSHLQQEFKFWHDKQSNLNPKSMFRLAKLGVPPSIYLDLKDDVPLCASCMFWKVGRRKWITKWNKEGYRRNETDTNTRDGVSLDQIQSSQTVLVPQFFWQTHKHSHLDRPSHYGPFQWLKIFALNEKNRIRGDLIIKNSLWNMGCHIWS